MSLRMMQMAEPCEDGNDPLGFVKKQGTFITSWAVINFPTSTLLYVILQLVNDVLQYASVRCSAMVVRRSSFPLLL
jgi:hypothetical protein